MKRIAFIFALWLLALPLKIFSQKIITVDYQSVIDTVKDLQGGNKLWDKTAPLLHNEGMDMIRTHDYHHLLDYSDYSAFWNFDGTGNYTINQSFDPYNPDDYDWLGADSVTDDIKNHQFDIFFRIGVSYPNGNIHPLPPYDPPCNSSSTPLDFSRFASLSVQTYKHYNEGWDNGKTDSIVYWEVWNEPGGLFWNGSVNQFYKMYEAVADSMKAYNPDMKIGAPGAVPSTTIGVNPAYRENFINFCSLHGVPLDFYSWHIYGAKNPYGIKAFADTIRSLLDQNGYANSESIISEINSMLNSSLDTLMISPYGAAYYLSTLLTAQEAPVDKVLWYPSCVGVKNMSTGDTMRTRTYYAMTCFSRLQKTTPLEVYNDGNVVVDGNWDSYEENFMVLSGKSADEQKFSVLISNLAGSIDNIRLVLQNLPFNGNDSVRIVKSIISSDYQFYTEENIVNGGSVITIDVPDCPLPGVLFYRLEKAVATNSVSNGYTGKLEITSPAHDVLYLHQIPAGSYRLRIFNMTGVRVKDMEVRKTVDISNLPAGVYLLRIYGKGFPCITRRFVKQ